MSRARALRLAAAGLGLCAAVHAVPGRTLHVAVDGSAEFVSIQQALDTIPPDNRERITLRIADGLYSEKLRIVPDRITLSGASRDGVVIQFHLPRSEYDKRPDRLGPGVVNVHGNDVILQHLTIRNTQPDTGVHAFAIYGQPDRMILADCTVTSQGGDTVSLWNTAHGRYYHAGCRFVGGVDSVCPRGWCFIRDSQFESTNGSAILWHDGHLDPDMKFVLRNCQFDGPEGTWLGRNHYPSQFYLLDCTLSANIADKPIGTVKDTASAPDAPLYERRYFHATHRAGGDWAWLADNLDTAAGSPAAEAITPAWTFAGSWDPESTQAPVVTHCETAGDRVTVQFSEPVAGFAASRVLRADGSAAGYLAGNGTHRVVFAAGADDPAPVTLDPNGDTLYGTVAALAPRIIASPLALPPAVPRRNITVLCIGDSTVATYDPDHAYQGWGWALPRFFDDRVTVVNRARSGRSSESFRGEGHWAQARQVKADYVFIQFGHNDNPGKGPGRETTPGPTGTFRANLRRYVHEIRDEMGAQPILVTPSARRFYTEQGAVHPPEGEGNLPYAEAVRAVAAEEHVPVVDLNARTRELFERLGEATSNCLQPEGDRTHWSPYGARVIGAIVVRDALPQLPALAPFVLPDALTRAERR